MIKFMVDGGYVPCLAAYLYRLIKRVEEKHLAIGGEWSRGCRNTEKAAQRKKKDVRFYRREDPDDDVFPRQKVEPKMKLKLDPDRDGSRPNLCGKTGWKGTLVLQNLIPVSFGCDLDLFFKENRQELSSGKELVFYGQARKHARNIDIVRTLELKLRMKISTTTITAMTVSFGSISVQNVSLLPRILMMQDQAEFSQKL